MARGLKTVRNRHEDALSRIGWQALERLLAEHYRQAGFDVEHVGTGGAGRRFDGGIDLKLRRDDAYVLVQAKHWNAYQVTHNAVHELLGIMVNESATGAILVTSGEFTKAALDAATRQGHVQLIDGAALREMLGPIDPGPEMTVPRLSPPRHDRDRHAGRDNRIWLLVAGIGALVFILIAHALLERTAWTAGPTPARTPLPTVAPVASPVPQPSAVTVQASDCELIDHFSGTVMCDGVVMSPNSPPPTAAEIRESQRRADEAMKVLEPTTPEM